MEHFGVRCVLVVETVEGHSVSAELVKVVEVLVVLELLAVVADLVDLVDLPSGLLASRVSLGGSSNALDPVRGRPLIERIQYGWWLE